MEVLGIDIGGTGIKGAPVDIASGQLTSERFRLSTPEGARPEEVAQTVRAIVHHFSWHGRIGAAMPVRVRDGIALTASNIDSSWIGTNIEELFSRVTDSDVVTLNDADAAGYAEIHYGAGKGVSGKTLVLTFGTGIGSSLFVGSTLVPNIELGHVRMHNTIAEAWAANSARKRENLSWEDWADRLQEYLNYIEFLFDPELIILGGGVSRPKRVKRFFHLLRTTARLAPAHFQNEAGIIGAACAAHSRKP